MARKDKFTVTESSEVEKIDSDIKKADVKKPAAKKSAPKKGDISKGEEIDVLKIEADILKGGRPAAIGTVKDWKGKKYKKISATKWQEQRQTKTTKENYIDEDTGEIVTIERKWDVTPKDSRDTDTRKEKDTSASQKKRVKKTGKRADAAYDRFEDLKAEYKAQAFEFNTWVQEYKALQAEMNQKAGEMGDKWTDDHANEYGTKMNALQKKISAKRPKLKKLAEKVEDAKHETTNRTLDHNEEYLKMHGDRIQKAFDILSTPSIEIDIEKGRGLPVGTRRVHGGVAVEKQ